MLRLHWCTVGIFKFGSNVMSAGEFCSNASFGVRNVDGFTVGAASVVRKLELLILTSGSDEHPVVKEPPGVAEQRVTRPGTFPATAVAWKEEIVSNARR